MKSTKVCDLAEQIRGVSYSRGEASDSPSPDCLPILRATNITDNGLDLGSLVYVPKKRISEKQLLRKGDVVIAASSGSLDVVGKAAQFDLDLPISFGAFCKVLRPTKNINKKYFSYFFKTLAYRRTISLKAAGANINNLRNDDLDSLAIYVPSSDSQTKTVNILGAAEKALNERREAIRLLDDFLKSTFFQMFGDPITNPMGWNVKKLDDLASTITNGTTPLGGENVYVKQGITFFRSQNVWNNKLEYADIAYIDENMHRGMRKSSLKNGDILMTKTGRFNTENSSLGRVAMFFGEDDSANINGHVYLIRLDERIRKEFVLFVLTTSAYQNYIRTVSVGGIDKRQINKSHLQEFPIIFPPLNLQNKFVSTVENAEKLKQKMKSSETELQNIFNCLMQKAFKGEL